jgi:hypothetical protein
VFGSNKNNCKRLVSLALDLTPKYRVIRNKNVFNKDEMSLQRGSDLYENISIETVLLVETDH